MMPLENPVLLVDVSALYSAAWHTQRDGDGPLEVAHSTVGRVKRLAQGYQHVAICADDPAGNWRDKVYPLYKAHRKEKPPGYAQQLAHALDLLRAAGFPVWLVEDNEADDVIASAVTRALEGEHDVMIASGDKDLAQLVGLHVHQLNISSGKNEEQGPDEIIKRYGVRPDQIGDYLALIGDTADNIPHHKGIGETVAAKLLGEYGTLLGVITAAGENKLKPAGNKLILEASTAATEGAKPLLSLSRELVTLRDYLEIPWNDVFLPRKPLTTETNEEDMFSSESDVAPLGEQLTTAIAASEPDRKLVAEGAAAVAAATIEPVAGPRLPPPPTLEAEKARILAEARGENEHQCNSEIGNFQCGRWAVRFRCPAHGGAPLTPALLAIVKDEEDASRKKSSAQPPFQPPKPAPAAVAAPPPKSRFTVTRGAIRQPHAFIIHGKSGIGKTFLASEIPNVFFICTEAGLKGASSAHIDTLDRFDVQPRSVNELIEMIDAFKNMRAGHRLLAIDSLSGIEKLVNLATCQSESVAHMDAKGWKVLYTAAIPIWTGVQQALDRVRAIGIHVMLIAHSSSSREPISATGDVFNKDDLAFQGSGDSLALLRQFWRQWADHVLFMEWDASISKSAGIGKRAVAKYSARVIRTRETPQYYAKNRANMPDKLPATWPDIVKALAAGAPASSEKLRGQIDALMPHVPDESRTSLDQELARATSAAALSAVLSRAQGLISAAREDDEPEHQEVA